MPSAVVHYAVPGITRGACRHAPLWNHPMLTTAPEQVTCGNCRKRPEWRKAALAPEWQAPLDELLACGGEP